jgi:hypothetical protein
MRPLITPSQAHLLAGPDPAAIEALAASAVLIPVSLLMGVIMVRIGKTATLGSSCP